MREMLENALWKIRFAVEKKFLRDERGDSNMVAVIVLIVIIIAVATIFNQQLVKAVNTVMDRFTEFVG